MAMVLNISDGTTTVDFTGADYKVVTRGWAPQRAVRTSNLLGGREFDLVSERLAIRVMGTSQSDVLANLGTLSDLLDQAARWGRGDTSATAVYIQYGPNGSSLATAPKSPIYGAAGGKFLQLPRSFEFQLQDGRDGLGDLRDPIYLTFVRDPYWYGATESESSTQSTGNPVKVTTTAFTDTAGIPWPYDVAVEFSAALTNTQENRVFVGLSNDADKLYLAEAESLSLSANFSSTVESGASAGSVARCNSSSAAGGQITQTAAIPNWDSNGKTVAWYCMARNKSPSTVDWTLYLGAVAKGTYVYTRKKRIPAGDNNRQIIELGITSSPETVTSFTLYAENSTTGTATTDDLDIDYIVGIHLDNSTRIYSCLAGGVSQVNYQQIEQRLLTDINPLFYTANTKDIPVVYSSYQGDIRLGMTGNTLSAVVFGCETDGSSWVIENTVGPEVDITLHATRTAAYLTPY